MVAVSLPETPSRTTTTMKAIVQRRDGPPENVLHVEEVEVPALGDDGVLVRVRASSVNPADSYPIRGVPLVVRLAMIRQKSPEWTILGSDVAGEVEAVGKDVTEFRPGDAVFGSRRGAWAEYVRAGASNVLVPKPPNVSFEQAGAVGIAGITALQGLRDKGRIRPGHRVLIDGASGGVGTFAVQIAKAFGAHVTAVCSGRNVDMVRSIGADEVIDYTRESLPRGQRYDLIVDIAGGHSLRQLKGLLARDGMFVVIGARSKSGWFPMLSRIFAALVWSRFNDHVVMFVARMKKDDMLTLKELMDAGKLRPVVDRTYPLSATVEAVRYQEAGHARAKVVITM
jgi:NADPH:quinone reductase-like Zn-dependent oxidoreductase